LALKTEEVTKVKLRSLAQATKIELGQHREVSSISLLLVSSNSWLTDLLHLSSQESKAYITHLVVNEEYLLEALCYDLAVEHPQAILVHAHSALRNVRPKQTSSNLLPDTPTTKSEAGGETPKSFLDGKTPGSLIGAKTPGSGLGSVMDMDIDSPLSRRVSFDATDGGKERPSSQDDAEEMVLDLATEILMAT
jgi:hypothetical protein